MNHDLFEDHELRSEVEARLDDEAEERRELESAAQAIAGLHVINALIAELDEIPIDERPEENMAGNEYSEKVRSATPGELVALRTAIDVELKRRADELAKQLAEVQHAVAGTKPRATRRDKGTTRAPKLTMVTP